MKRKFLVTGGAGFIGSNLCDSLIELGHEVRVLDNLATGSEENIRSIKGPVEFIKGDIRDAAVVASAMRGMDNVVHLAALGSVPRSVADPVTTHDVNATGTLVVLNAAREAGVKRLVYASSSSAYGDTPVLPKQEDMTPTPQSPYAVSKLTGEQYCRVFYRVYGLETVALRYFNVYGRRQSPDSQYAAVIPLFVSALMKSESPVINGDGEQTRDFTYVDDCNQANIKASLAEGSAGEVFNVGTGARISINMLFDKIRSELGSDTEAVHAKPRAGDVRDSLSDISRISAAVGYSPNYNIDTGLAETVRWFADRSGERP